MNAGVVVILGLILLSVLGVPIFLSLGISTVAAMTMSGMPFIVVPQKMFAGINSVSLLAIPFFMLAGNIMSRGITIKLINVSNAFIGWIKGSLGIVTVLSSALFGAISGSATATVTAIGGTTIPAMKKEGYPDHFAAAIASMASILGPMIPPSITLIVYGSITETSISKLFLASVIPGLLFCTMLLGYTLFYGKKHDLPSKPKKSAKEIGATLKDGVWALFMPVIILGGIFGGIFTATEASAVAVVYALLISLFVYKDLSIKELPKTLVEAAVSTAAILMLVALSKSSSYVIVTSRLPQAVLGWFQSFTSSPYIILILINIMFLLIGMFMEANAAIVMMTPLLMPLMSAFHIDPIHFGLIMSVNLYIGLVTPPVGISILLGNQMAGAKLEETLKSAMPMIGLALIILLLVTYIPALTTWLPSVFG